MREGGTWGETEEGIPRWKWVVSLGAVTVVALVAGIVALSRLWPPVGDVPPYDAGAASPRVVAAAGGGRSETATVHAALEAWEAFARSADLDDVRDTFVAEGPQFRQFRREVRTGQAGVDRVPDMSVQSVAAVEARGKRREVVARVAVTGTDGRRQVRDWVFVLERSGGKWRVWTVVERTS